MLLFSIIIPSYNRSSLLHKAIKSIYDQSVKTGFEVIIVDDGSTDDTSAMVKALCYPELHYYYQHNQGQSVARNLGVSKAKGEYIIFMDDDDYWLPNHLQQFKNAIGKHPVDRKIYRTGFMRERPEGKRVKAPNYNSRKHLNPVRFAAFNMCALVTLCIPTAFLEKNHSPPGFPHWQDTHLILRLFAQFPFEQLPEYTYIYVIHKKMGSLKNHTKDTIYKRAEINVAAIKHLFENYYQLVAPFLPARTLKFLIAEKYMEYANLELVIGHQKNHWKLFKKSLASKFDIRLWKHYILFVKYLLFK